MLFGIDIKDTTKPLITSIYAYPIGDSSSVNNSNVKQKLRLIPQNNGDYITESVEAYGTVGFGVNTTDRQDLAANRNGVYNIQTFINGTQNLDIDFSKFSFDETIGLNRFIDYEQYKTKSERVQKLYNDNNGLSIF